MLKPCRVKKIFSIKMPEDYRLYQDLEDGDSLEHIWADSEIKFYDDFILDKIDRFSMTDHCEVVGRQLSHVRPVGFHQGLINPITVGDGIFSRHLSLISSKEDYEDNYEISGSIDSVWRGR